jgi:hypothetical protein
MKVGHFMSLFTQYREGPVFIFHEMYDGKYTHRQQHYDRYKNPHMVFKPSH